MESYQFRLAAWKRSVHIQIHFTLFAFKFCYLMLPSSFIFLILFDIIPIPNFDIQERWAFDQVFPDSNRTTILI